MITEWPTPIPLAAPSVPPFPLHALPLNLRLYAEELAEAAQVPPDLPTMLMLAVGAAALANKYEVHITPDWREPCNLFVAVVLPPGHRKSAIFRAVVAPLDRAETELRDLDADAVADRTQTYRIMEAALREAERRAKNADDAERTQAIEEAKELRRKLPEHPALPRLLADDASPEQLAVLLAENGGRIALMSAEGGVFETMAGRYSNGIPNLDVYLKGHSGDAIRVDRVGRPPILVQNPALTIGLAIQPEVIQGLATKPSFRGRGLIARFLYSIPHSALGYRKVETEPVDPATRLQYETTVNTLLRVSSHDIHANDGTAHRLCLDRDAKNCLRDYRQDIERDLAPGGGLEYAPDWGGKLPGAVVRIAGILHAYKHPDAPHAVVVSEETMVAAIHIGNYLRSHAAAVLDLMGIDPIIEDARHVLNWIRRTELAEFSQRQAYQALKGRFKHVHQLLPVLALLRERGYLVRVSIPARTGPGRNAGPFYATNPACLASFPKILEKASVSAN
jgi:hypothetical protein